MQKINRTWEYLKYGFMRNHSLVADYCTMVWRMVRVFCYVLILCTLHDLLNLNCVLLISLILWLLSVFAIVVNLHSDILICEYWILKNFLSKCLQMWKSFRIFALFFGESFSRNSSKNCPTLARIEWNERTWTIGENNRIWETHGKAVCWDARSVGWY